MITLNPRARLMIPDGLAAPEALRRTTHLGIGAHQDDLEFMAFHGILACYDQKDRWFGGVTITDGRGSSRAGKFQDWTDDQIAAERIREQDAAAVIGQYAFMAQLGHPSKSVRDARETVVREDLFRLLEATRPEFVYLHNLADKHDTHVGCALRCLEALRRLPKADRPHKVYGCEVWRDLDWLVDSEKTPMPVSGRPELARALNEVFATQIAGGKRYDLAVIGRRTANATFSQAHATDQESAMQWAMDLTPLVQDDSLDPIAYATGFIDRLKADVTARLRQSL
ncbi:MAG: PIG-L family deacetylase [Opitutales bacterium]|nr:PIG-L family deacetylase [Opitutales bacterium]MDP4659256.1 PIG-L family deacetylase [Opitutales bacterium]MDP4787177.1 PIG-L family deacetylase [Opitutales bacterium]MDP4895262.1 PIG-L family deacetylase [Opitutales bacterium]